jgi:2-polyprenyl-6-methoxyphenol hydroxylase-like FAD-dependent oxidoreductase
MSRIVVLGAGMCGLATGMMLARDGHAVTVLERDQAAVPDSPEQAWEDWSRDGVAQFRQAHYLQPGGRAVLESTLPDVAAALEAAGAIRFDALCMLPPAITDRAPRAGDERFVTITARRPVLEHVLGRAAHSEPGVEIRRGVDVRALLTHSYDGTPHITGVRTESGEVLDADLVVDAMGRRSQLPRWLAAAGCRALHEETEDAGFIYYTRYFRSLDGRMPQPRGPLMAAIGTFSLVTLPADNGTWSVTAYISTGDRPLKRLRDPDRFTAAVAACPLQAHWLEGEPITGIAPMSGVIDRYRRLVVDGRPVATGVAMVADAWACTNPVLGRGTTLGLMHARRLRDVARAHLDDPRRFATAWDAVTEAELTPWYRETVAENRARLRELEPLHNRREPAHPTQGPEALTAALLAAMPHDADLFRVFLAARCCITPLYEAFANDQVVERIREVARDRDCPKIPGPNREQLLELLNRHGSGRAALGRRSAGTNRGSLAGPTARAAGSSSRRRASAPR